MFTVLKDGKTGVGTETPVEKFQVGEAGNQGNIRVEGTVTTCIIGNGVGATNCTSDLRLKENIVPIANSLEKIKKIRGVYYNWIESYRNSERLNMGVIAQEVESVFPGAVTVDQATGYKMVDFTSLIFPLIEATKEIANQCEQSASNLKKIETLRAQVNRELNDMKELFKKLQDQVELKKQKIIKKKVDL